MGLGDQRVAVRLALQGAARLALEGNLAVAGIAPHLGAGHRIDLQDAAVPTLTEAAQVVEQQNMAVGQDVGVVLGQPAAAARPDDALGLDVQHGDGVDVAERQQHLPLLRKGQDRSLPGVYVVDVVGVDEVVLVVPDDAAQEAVVAGVRQGIEDGDLLELPAVGREDDEEVVEPRDRQLLVLGEGLVAHLVGQPEDASVGREVEVVVGLAQVAPDDVGVLVQLHHAIAPGGVAGRHEQRQQVAVRQQAGLAPIKEGVPLRVLHRRGFVPDRAVGQLPAPQKRAVEGDQRGLAAMAGGVEGIAGLRLGLVHRDAGFRAPLELPEVRGQRVLRLLRLGDVGLSAPVGVADGAGGEDVEQDDKRAAQERQEKQGSDEGGEADPVDQGRRRLPAAVRRRLVGGSKTRHRRTQRRGPALRKSI